MDKPAMNMRLVILASAVVSAFVVVPVAYMIADNLPPYEYDAEMSYLRPNPASPHQQMIVRWHFKKINRVCPGVVTRHIVDATSGARISYDPTPAATTIELADHYLDRTFTLPYAITPGPKLYYSDGEYTCNMIQRFYPLRVATPRLRFDVAD